MAFFIPFVPWRPELEEHYPEFVLAIPKFLHKIYSNDYIVRTEKLKAWLRDTPADGVKSNFHCMMERALRQPLTWNHAYLNLRTDRRMDIVFCTLLIMGRPESVAKFFQSNFFDSTLPRDPFQKDNLVAALGLNSDDGQRERLSEEFGRIHRILRPGQFEDRPALFGKEKIFPFHRKEALMYDDQNQETHKGATAKAYRVETLEKFLDPDLRARIQGSCYDAKSEDLGRRYPMILKTFTQKYERSYENEVKVLEALRREAERGFFVRHLGNFRHEQPRKSRSLVQPSTDTPDYQFSILFEDGDFDLNEYFKQAAPPLTSGEIVRFWDKLFIVVQALSILHNFDIDGTPAMGWHSDIKTDNILVINNKFVLADVGYAKIFHGNSRRSTMSVAGGTGTFKAPESLQDRRYTVEQLQSMDVWSLGTVLLIAATWVVAGQKGIEEFGALREIAVRKASARHAHAPSASLLLKGDLFHDGVKLLPEVEYWHQYLKGTLRKTDMITDRILDLILDKLLVGDASQRTSSGETFAVFKTLMEESHLQRQTPSHIDILPGVFDSVREAKQTAYMGSQSSSLDTESRQQVQRIEGENVIEAVKKTKIDNLRWNLANSAVEPTPNSFPFRPNIPPLAPLVIEVSEPSNVQRIDLQAQAASPSVNRSYHNSQPMSPTPQPSSGQHETPPTPSTAGKQRLKRARPMDEPENAYSAWNRDRRKRHRRQDSTVLTVLQKVGLSLFQNRVKKLIRYYEDRDIIFLVDNGTSMKPHWDETTFLMHQLLNQCPGLDKDGIDMFFTRQDAVHCEDQKNVNAVKDVLDNAKNAPIDIFKTDMMASLRLIFEPYLAEWRNFVNANQPRQQGYKKSKLKDSLNRRPTKPRNCTLLILTDGKWERMQNRRDVDPTIVNFYRQLQTLAGQFLHERTFTIQFIHFGEEEIAKHLQDLDDNLLSSRSLPDFIDTEPSGGDIFKMFLGSLDDSCDALDNSEEYGPSSPSPQGQPGSNGFMYDYQMYTHRAGPSNGNLSPQQPPGFAYQYPAGSVAEVDAPQHVELPGSSAMPFRPPNPPHHEYYGHYTRPP